MVMNSILLMYILCNHLLNNADEEKEIHIARQSLVLHWDAWSMTRKDLSE